MVEDDDPGLGDGALAEAGGGDDEGVLASEERYNTLALTGVKRASCLEANGIGDVRWGEVGLESERRGRRGWGGVG